MKMNKVGVIFKLLVVNSEGRERKDLRRGRESRPLSIHTSSTKTVRMFKLRPPWLSQRRAPPHNSCSFFRSKESKHRKSHMITSPYPSLHTQKCVLQCVLYDDGTFSSSCMTSKKQRKQTLKSMIWQQIREFFKYKKHHPSPHPVLWRREKGKEWAFSWPLPINDWVVEMNLST